MDKMKPSNVEHIEYATEHDFESKEANAITEADIVNPFRGKTYQQMQDAIDTFLKKTQLTSKWHNFIRRGAFLAQDRDAYLMEREDGLTLEHFEYVALSRENVNDRRKWKQRRMLYALIVCCSMAAATQGWDETAVNQAQIYYQFKFDLVQQGRLGLVNAAPYLGCAVLGCWLTEPMNRYFGRRGTIFLGCIISSLTCLWQGLCTTWWHLLIARFFLGVGIGPKSATVPIYGSECAPKQIRGALVMQWQMWTAFGIMLGILSGVVFQNVTSGDVAKKLIQQCDGIAAVASNSTMINDGYRLGCGEVYDLRWRLIIASPMILPLVVCLYVFTLPESPRWLLSKAKSRSIKPEAAVKYYQKALSSLASLRNTELEAARDMFLLDAQLDREFEAKRKGHRRILDLVRRPRNYRALRASLTLMFFQQQCGVNVLAFYSSLVFTRAGFDVKRAEQASMGFGIINFVFAIPAVFLIDTVGRRNLLLFTFPLMSLFQFLTGFAFLSKDRKVTMPLVTIGMYLFAMAYSPGEGPVPFLYSSECLPMSVREIGMSLNTAVLWLMNFMLSVTFPSFLEKFTKAGAFAWYGAWCIVGWFCILLFVYETKNQTLEELDARFSVSTRDHAIYGLSQIPYFFKRYILRRRGAKKPVLDLAKVAPFGSASLQHKRRPRRKIASSGHGVQVLEPVEDKSEWV